MLSSIQTYLQANTEETDIDKTEDLEPAEPSAPKEILLEVLILRLLKNYTRYKLKHQFDIFSGN